LAELRVFHKWRHRYLNVVSTHRYALLVVWLMPYPHLTPSRTIHDVIYGQPFRGVALYLLADISYHNYNNNWTTRRIISCQELAIFTCDTECDKKSCINLPLIFFTTPVIVTFLGRNLEMKKKSFLLFKILSIFFTSLERRKFCCKKMLSEHAFPSLSISL